MYEFISLYFCVFRVLVHFLFYSPFVFGSILFSNLQIYSKVRVIWYLREQYNFWAKLQFNFPVGTCCKQQQGSKWRYSWKSLDHQILWYSPFTSHNTDLAKAKNVDFFAVQSQSIRPLSWGEGDAHTVCVSHQTEIWVKDGALGRIGRWHCVGKQVFIFLNTRNYLSHISRLFFPYPCILSPIYKGHAGRERMNG